jgi:hypothetical protein
LLVVYLIDLAALFGIRHKSGDPVGGNAFFPGLRLYPRGGAAIIAAGPRRLPRDGQP